MEIATELMDQTVTEFVHFLTHADMLPGSKHIQSSRLQRETPDISYKTTKNQIRENFINEIPHKNVP